jgi:hypothetical protein
VVISHPIAKNMIDITAGPPPMSMNTGDSHNNWYGKTFHYSRLVCVFIRRSRTEEDETQLGKPNTAKSRKRDKERAWIRGS